MEDSKIKKRPIILDTDIGNDVDDIFALIMLAKLRQFKLTGVTTVYGDTTLQTRMVRYVLDLLGRTDVPCFAGETKPYDSTLIRRGNHISGGFPKDFHRIRADTTHSNAVDFLIEQSLFYEGELEIIAIGPLTNIAKAIDKDPGFSGRIKHLTMMAGLFDEKDQRLLDKINVMPGEYNIVCDTTASIKVCDSGIPATFIPLDITTTAYFSEKEKQLFSRLPFGLGEILEKELSIWWNLQRAWDPQMQDSNHPHDPIAIVALYRPEWFEFKEGKVSIGEAAKKKEMTIISDSENIHRYARKMDIEKVTQEMINVIIGRT